MQVTVNIKYISEGDMIEKERQSWDWLMDKIQEWTNEFINEKENDKLRKIAVH